MDCNIFSLSSIYGLNVKLDVRNMLENFYELLDL